MSRKTIEHTREEIDLLLNQLRWGTLSSALKLQYNTPQYEALAFEKRLLVALEFVCQERVTRRLKRTFKKMPPKSLMETLTNTGTQMHDNVTAH